MGSKFVRPSSNVFRAAAPTLVRWTIHPRAARVNGAARARFGCGDDEWGAHAGWDSDGDSFHAWTDPLGMWPLFYHVDGGTVRVSDSLYAIVRDLPRPRRLNVEAMAVFLRLGYFLDNETPFEDVRVLGPGGRLRADSAGARVSEAPPAPSDLVVSDREGAWEEYARLFRAAVGRCLDRVGAPSAMFLSGGRDSRMILLTLYALGAPPRICVTLGSGLGEDTDVGVASRLCARLGLEHHVVLTRDPDFNATVASFEASHLCADEHGWIAPASEYLAGLTDVAYDGIAGDVLGGGLFLNERLIASCEGEEWRRASSIVLERSVLTERQRSAAARWLGVESRSDVEGRIAEALIARRDEISPSSMFYFWSRTRREIALLPFGIERRIPSVAAPFLDREFVRFASAIPARWRLGKAFHSEAIHRMYPDVADIPFATARNRYGRLGAYAESYPAAVVAASRAGGFGGAAALRPLWRNLSWIAYLTALRRLAEER